MLVSILLIARAPATAQEKSGNYPAIKPAASALPDILLRIATCESGNRQFDESGNVVRGIENPQDVGRFQINEYWNGKEAARLGFDIYTLAGNTAMALHLYHLHGTRDWSWSRWCWG